jgi:hypothetical protein
MKYPSKFDLVECWLKTYYAGVPYAVFFHPNKDGADRMMKIAKRFSIPEKEFSCMLAGDICICQSQDEPIDSIVNSLSEEEYGYVISWDGNNFATENT